MDQKNIVVVPKHSSWVVYLVNESYLLDDNQFSRWCRQNLRGRWDVGDSCADIGLPLSIVVHDEKDIIALKLRWE